ncbi:MAG: cardiolipin synthase [Clostridia bacterium]|nr:cardiolipin synthase [Clostridia bacterium]
MKSKKSEKNIINTIIKSIVAVIVFVLQILVFYFMYMRGIAFANTFTIGSVILQLILVLYLLNGKGKLVYKIPWLIFIMFFPVAGTVIYILSGERTVNRKLKKAREITLANSHHLFDSDEDVLKEIKAEVEDTDTPKQVNLLRKLTNYPVRRNEGLEYYEIGEKCFDAILDDMEKAEKYILIEYFILAKGKLWDKIYNIIEQKLKQKVKVIIIADGWGSVLRYPTKQMKELEELGAIVKKYNPIRFGINHYINYRDHRKIVVIDGTIGYTGGVNVADEYVNEQQRFGHWKDTGVKIIGKPVENLVIAFLKIFELVQKETPDYKWFLDNKKDHEVKENKNGYLMFFTDGPDNKKNPSENIHISMINAAKEYIYIYTPYFIASQELLGAILNAANSGIDVRIITPSHPDKWYVHMTTRSYYEILLEAGVKVYEYLPGFLHAKSFITDDNAAVIGSINLDYRSMNLNFECGVWMHDTGIEKDIKEDFINTMKLSKEITLEEVKKKNIFVKIIEAILKTFAPML